MDRRSLSVVACLIALGVVGMYFYERQLIELRGELEEARLLLADRSAAERARRAAEEALRAQEGKKQPDRPQGHSAEALYEEARALEQAGKEAEAIRMYIRAARAGSEPATKRLEQIHEPALPRAPRPQPEPDLMPKSPRV
jgi:hypothetical protein